MELLLSNNFVLRKNVDGTNILYDKSSNMIYHITNKLFTFLYFFKDNIIDLDVILAYFEKNDISIEDIKVFLSRTDMKDLLVKPSLHHRKNRSQHSNIYHSLSKITKFTEYTPERIDFLITKKCNLKCKHCFENASPLEETHLFNMEILKTVFHQMDDLNVKTLKITGGEPFTHPQFLSILEEIANAHFETIILTNGMLLTEHSMNLIKSSNIKLGISLDGISSNTHDFLRGKGAFATLYTILKHLGALGVDLTLTFTANKINEKELEQLASIAFEEFGVRCIFVNRLRPIGRAKKNSDMFIPDEEYTLFQDRVANLALKYGKKRIALSDDSLPINTQDLEQLSENSPLVCAAGNTVLCMDESLDVYPCIYGQGNKNYIIGNLSKDTLLNIWQSEKWMPFRGKTVLSQIKGCCSCEKKDSCGIKNCRLKPVYNGLGFYDHISYCNR